VNSSSYKRFGEIFCLHLLDRTRVLPYAGNHIYQTIRTANLPDEFSYSAHLILPIFIISLYQRRILIDRAGIYI
jgi:hypothetical protein